MRLVIRPSFALDDDLTSAHLLPGQHLGNLSVVDFMRQHFPQPEHGSKLAG